MAGRQGRLHAHYMPAARALCPRHARQRARHAVGGDRVLCRDREPLSQQNFSVVTKFSLLRQRDAVAKKKKKRKKKEYTYIHTCIYDNNNKNKFFILLCAWNVEVGWCLVDCEVSNRGSLVCYCKKIKIKIKIKLNNMFVM